MALELNINILAHNEEDIIARCIRSVLNQKINSDDSIIINVISNGSTDNTDAIVNRLADDNNNIRLYSYAEPGKVNAIRSYLNSILKSPHKKNKILFFMDADIELHDNDILCKLYEKLQSDDRLYAVCANVTPDSVFNCKADYVSLLSRMQYKVLTDVKPNRFRGALYCILPDIMYDVTFPSNLLSDDIFLEIYLDGHFSVIYDTRVVHKLHYGIIKEIRRNLLHSIGVAQAYTMFNNGVIGRLDKNGRNSEYKSSYIDLKDICNNFSLYNLIYFPLLLVNFAYNKVNMIRAASLINKLGVDYDYRSYWKTRK